MEPDILLVLLCFVLGFGLLSLILLSLVLFVSEVVLSPAPRKGCTHCHNV